MLYYAFVESEIVIITLFAMLKIVTNIDTDMHECHGRTCGYTKRL